MVGEERLARAIGPATRIIGISSGEPTGLGMNSSTMTAVAADRFIRWPCFRPAAPKVHRLTPGHLGQDRFGRAGGLASGRRLGPAAETGHRPRRGRLCGKGPGGRLPPAPPARAFAGRALRRLGPGRADSAHSRASTMGVVEIEPRLRGWAARSARSPACPWFTCRAETIFADVRTNVAAGVNNVALLSEDFFRLWGQGVRTDPEGRCLRSSKRIRQIPQVRVIQLDHANSAQRCLNTMIGSSRHATICWSAAICGVRCGSMRAWKRPPANCSKRSAGAANRPAASREPWGDPAPGELAAALPRRVLPHGQPDDRAARRARGAPPRDAGLGAIAQPTSGWPFFPSSTCRWTSPRRPIRAS